MNCNIGPELIISSAGLSGIDPATLSKFLSDNNTALIKRINEAAKAELLKGETDCAVPAFVDDPDFRGKSFTSWYASLRKRVCQEKSKGSVLPLLLPVAVYLHDAYGLTCSRLILGCEMPVVPPVWVQNWLALANKLTAEETQELYNIFDQAVSGEQDTVFVLKSRLLEMATERGARPDEFIMYPGLLVSDVPTIRDFINTPIREKGNAYLTMKPFLGNHKMLRLIICMSVLYQVSPDYLLLEDYSSCAIAPNGRYYDPATRDLLSRLLLADATTRAKATGYVLAVTTQRIEAGGTLPNVIWQQTEKRFAGKDDTVNVMETFSSAKGVATRKGIEQQIVASLKPKLLALLSLNSEPVSSARLFEVVDGHNRLARRALLELEKEGKVEKITMDRGAATWRIVKSRK